MLIRLSMSASGIAPSDLLSELKSCGTDIASGEEVELYKDGEFYDGLMIEHLKKLPLLNAILRDMEKSLWKMAPA